MFCTKRVHIQVQKGQKEEEKKKEKSISQKPRNLSLLLVGFGTLVNRSAFLKI